MLRRMIEKQWRMIGLSTDSTPRQIRLGRWLMSLYAIFLTYYTNQEWIHNWIDSRNIYDREPVTANDFQQDFVDEVKRTQPWMVAGAVDEIVAFAETFGYEAACDKYDKGVVDEIIRRGNLMAELDGYLDECGSRIDEENLAQREEIRAEQAATRHYEDGDRDSI